MEVHILFLQHGKKNLKVSTAVGTAWPIHKIQSVRLTGKTAIYQITLRVPKVSLGVNHVLRVKLMTISHTVLQLYRKQKRQFRKISNISKKHRTVHFRSYKCITNYPKHIPKTPKSTFKFDLDLIFQGHFDRQSSKTLQHRKNLKITLFSSQELQYLILVDCLYCHKTHIIVVLIS